MKRTQMNERVDGLRTRRVPLLVALDVEVRADWSDAQLAENAATFLDIVGRTGMGASDPYVFRDVTVYTMQQAFAQLLDSEEKGV